MPKESMCIKDRRKIGKEHCGSDLRKKERTKQRKKERNGKKIN